MVARSSFRTASIAVLMALGVSMLWNATSISRALQHKLTIADLGYEARSADQAYYFALIRDVNDGYFNLGQVALKEQRFASATGSYAAIVEGVLSRFLGGDIIRTVFISNLIFTFLHALLIFIACYGLLRSRSRAVLLSLCILGYLNLALLRTNSPQTTLLFLEGYFAAFFWQDHFGKKTTLLLRGTLIALLLYVQVLFASFAIAIEAVDALRRFMTRTHSFAETVRCSGFVLLPIVCAAFFLLFLARHDDPLAVADTLRRHGLIPTHLPAALFMQLKLVIALVLVWVCMRIRPIKNPALQLLLPLTIAGLLVLNQSLVHGKDLVFGLYYAQPLFMVLWFVFGACLVALIPQPRINLFILACFAAFQLISGLRIINAEAAKRAVRSNAFPASAEVAVMDALQKLPKEQVVLAPMDIANLVPVLTSHYVLFNQYAFYQRATDTELAQRYLLARSLFTFAPEYTVEGDPLVFGLYAGNLSARERTYCKIKSLFGYKDRMQCDIQLQDYIYHQNLRQFVEKREIDQIEMIKKYGVTVIVSDKSIPQNILQLCPRTETVQNYTIYRCTL